VTVRDRFQKCAFRKRYALPCLQQLPVREHRAGAAAGQHHGHHIGWRETAVEQRLADRHACDAHTVEFERRAVGVEVTARQLRELEVPIASLL
jgi:hypothetical protein